MPAQDAERSRPLVVVTSDAPEQEVTLTKGQPPGLQPGPGFAVYERRRDASGNEVEELITIVPGPDATLCAATDEQLKAWKGKRLFARPMRLEPS